MKNLILYFFLVFYSIFGCESYSDFEKVTSKEFLEKDHREPIINHHQLRDSLLVEKFQIFGHTVEGSSYVLREENNNKLEFKYPFYISDHNEEYFTLISGTRTFDSGLSYFFNKYSEIYIIDKINLSIINHFKIKGKTVSNNTFIENDYIYFWYGGSNNYKLGRIKLN